MEHRTGLSKYSDHCQCKIMVNIIEMKTRYDAQDVKMFVILSLSVLVAITFGGVIPSYHHGFDDYSHSSDLLFHGSSHLHGGHSHKVVVPIVKHVSVVKKVPVIKTVPVVKHVAVVKHVPVVKHVSVLKHVNVVKKVPVVKHVTVDLGHHIDDHSHNLHGLDLHGSHHGLSFSGLHDLDNHGHYSHKSLSHHY